MKTSVITIFIPFSILLNTAFSQNIDRKTVFECKVTFAVSVMDSFTTAKQAVDISKAVKISYVKGGKSRNDFISPGFRQTSIYTTSSDTIVILKQIGNEKYIRYLNSRLIKQKSDRYKGMIFITTHDSKNILNYECKKVQGQLADGTYCYVYYAAEIEPSNKEFEQQFKKLPGFVLEYEALLDDGKTRVRYTATSIDFSPVPASKFDWPQKGYRVL